MYRQIEKQLQRDLSWERIERMGEQQPSEKEVAVLVWAEKWVVRVADTVN